MNTYLKWMIHLKEFYISINIKVDLDMKEQNLKKEKLIKDIRHTKPVNNINNNFNFGLNDLEFSNVLDGFNGQLSNNSFKDQDQYIRQSSKPENCNNNNFSSMEERKTEVSKEVNKSQTFLTEKVNIDRTTPNKKYLKEINTILSNKDKTQVSILVNNQTKKVQTEKAISDNKKLKLLNDNITIPNNLQDEIKETTISFNIKLNSSNYVKRPMIEINNEWDGDFQDLRKFIAEKKKRSSSPSKTKKDLTDEINMRHINSLPKNDHLILHKIGMYRSEIRVFDDPFLHIKKSVNEELQPENLHFGILESTGHEILRETSKVTKKSLSNQKIDIPLNVDKVSDEREVIEYDDNSFTFSIKIPSIKNK